jgi:hypothetical protein
LNVGRLASAQRDIGQQILAYRAKRRACNPLDPTKFNEFRCCQPEDCPSAFQAWAALCNISVG